MGIYLRVVMRSEFPSYPPSHTTHRRLDIARLVVPPKSRKLVLVRERTPQTVTSKVSTGASKSLYQARPRSVAFPPKIARVAVHKSTSQYRYKSIHLGAYRSGHVNNRRSSPLHRSSPPSYLPIPDSPSWSDRIVASTERDGCQGE